MSYYPILSAPNVKGWTTLSNFSPNNWEGDRGQEKFVNLTWSSQNLWISKTIDIIKPDTFRTVTANEIENIVPPQSLTLLSLTQKPLPFESEILPKLDFKQTATPSWRATLGLSSSSAHTSYQGELDAFPPQGSLITFAPFLQFGQHIENYLLLLNLENEPIKRLAELEIYDAASLTLRGKFTVINNAINSIPLDKLGFGVDDLPLSICRNMAAIPLYFSSTKDGTCLSLEHTHPPASFVVHGRRWEAQKLIKKRWFSKVV